MFMSGRLVSVKNTRWQIHLNHFNKDNIKDRDDDNEIYFWKEMESFVSMILKNL